MFFTWWKWLRKLFGAGRTSHRRSERRYYRPCLEALEDRTVFNVSALDPTFGTGGTLTTAFHHPYSGLDEASAVAIQGDGRIVAAGYSTNGTDSDFALTRYNADGSLDSSFGAAGKVITTFGPGDDFAFGVAMQGDGKIVTAGYAWNGTNWDFALARLNTDGSLDTTFGTGGKVTTSLGPGDDIAHGMAIQDDGKILVVGSSFNGVNHDAAVVRYNCPRPNWDRSFYRINPVWILAC